MKWDSLANDVRRVFNEVAVICPQRLLCIKRSIFAPLARFYAVSSVVEGPTDVVRQDVGHSPAGLFSLGHSIALSPHTYNGKKPASPILKPNPDQNTNDSHIRPIASFRGGACHQPESPTGRLTEVKGLHHGIKRAPYVKERVTRRNG